MSRINRYKLEIFLLTFGLIVTGWARNYAVARRASLGLDPSWGGEFLIIPILAIAYLTLKSDWGFD